MATPRSTSFLLHHLQQMVIPLSALPSNAEKLFDGASDFTRRHVKPGRTVGQVLRDQYRPLFITHILHQQNPFLTMKRRTEYYTCFSLNTNISTLSRSLGRGYLERRTAVFSLNTLSPNFILIRNVVIKNILIPGRTMLPRFFLSFFFLRSSIFHL